MEQRRQVTIADVENALQQHAEWERNCNIAKDLQRAMQIAYDIKPNKPKARISVRDEQEAGRVQEILGRSGDYEIWINGRNPNDQ